MTLGSAAAAGVRPVVWCRDCGRQVEPDPTEHARRYGAGTTVHKAGQDDQTETESFECIRALGRRG